MSDVEGVVAVVLIGSLLLGWLRRRVVIRSTDLPPLCDGQSCVLDVEHRHVRVMRRPYDWQRDAEHS